MITPTKKEIREYMEAYNNDEASEGNKWTMEDAEYHLLLSDKYYYQNKAKQEGDNK